MAFLVAAGEGEFAIDLRRHGYHGRIVSFEPVPDTYSHLSQRAAHDRQWVTYNLALGAEAGTLPMQVPGMSTISSLSSFHAASQHGLQPFPGPHNATRHALSIERLDAVFAESVVGLANPRVYLKMDTQGWDLEVLKGAAGCLDYILALQSEMAVWPLYEGSPDYTEAVPFIRNLGFEISTIVPGYRDSDRQDLQLVEFDCVRVRPGATQH